MGGGTLEREYLGHSAGWSLPRGDRTPLLRQVVWTTLGSIAVCVGLALWLDSETIARGVATLQIAEGLRIVSATLFFGAGLLRVSRWRIRREPRSALMGVALIVFGSLTFPLSNIASLMHVSDAGMSLAPLTRLLTTMVTITLVVIALRGREVAEHLRPGLVTTCAMLTTMGCFAALVTAHQWLLLDLDPSPALHQRLEIAMALAWFGVAAGAVVQGRRLAWAARLAPLLAGMGVVGLFRAAAVQDLVPWTIAASALGTALAAVTLHCAMRDLCEATVQEGRRLQAVKDALSRAEEVLSAHDAWREELTHDARNAIAGLRGALLTLQRYDERLDAATAQRLRFAVLGEVVHLEHLIVRSDRDEIVEFDVGSVIRPVVTTQRAAGLDVRLRTATCSALGRPGDLATALRNLLVNAEKHAAAGTVTVRVLDRPDSIEIHVEDRGPGISPSRRDRLFDRGEKDARSTGSGLGLYVARTLMRQQDGDLELREGPGGGALFVLSLPTRATPVAPAQRPAIIAQRSRPVPVLGISVEVG